MRLEIKLTKLQVTDLAKSIRDSVSDDLIEHYESFSDEELLARHVFTLSHAQLKSWMLSAPRTLKSHQQALSDL